MFDHLSITVPALAPARSFYLAIMQALSVPLVGESDSWLGFGLRADADAPQRAYLSIRVSAACAPDAGRHICFKAPDRAAVDTFHAVGLAHGGRDDGPPGLRAHYHPHYYAAFVIDPAGNRLEAVCHLPASTLTER